MTTLDLQKWLATHGQPVIPDGLCGPKTRAAIIAAFTSSSAPVVTAADIDALATRLGCSARQIRAVSIVESGGNAFDKEGRPKILFERHLFHRYTQGKYTPSSFSNPTGGGYDVPSWDKLAMAACKDVDAAFSSTSWGKFQVLGLHWGMLGYSSPLEMAYSTVASEAAHYEMLARYIEANKLQGALKKLSTNPGDNADFARAYNGPNFRQFSYDEKLARALA